MHNSLATFIADARLRRMRNKINSLSSIASASKKQMKMDLMHFCVSYCVRYLLELRDENKYSRAVIAR